MVVNLGEYKKSTSKVFSGRDEGYEVRDKLNLNKIDNENITVIIEVPKDTLSINTSFFLGMFGDSVRKLGEAGFIKKYQFKCEPIIQKKVREGITRALKTSNPLG